MATQKAKYISKIKSGDDEYLFRDAVSVDSLNDLQSQLDIMKSQANYIKQVFLNNKPENPLATEEINRITNAFKNGSFEDLENDGAFYKVLNMFYKKSDGANIFEYKKLAKKYYDDENNPFSLNINTLDKDIKIEIDTNKGVVRLTPDLDKETIFDFFLHQLYAMKYIYDYNFYSTLSTVNVTKTFLEIDKDMAFIREWISILPQIKAMYRGLVLPNANGETVLNEILNLAGYYDNGTEYKYDASKDLLSSFKEEEFRELLTEIKNNKDTLLPVIQGISKTNITEEKIIMLQMLDDENMWNKIKILLSGNFTSAIDNELF